MSTLKVNKIRDTSGSADAIIFDPNGGAVLAGVTTVSTVKVGSGVTISSDGDVFTTGVTTSSTIKVGAAVTINSDGVVAAGIAVTCGSINGAPIGRKNALINGAFNVWQRGTSVTMLNSAKAMLCDRWNGSIQYQAGRHSRQSLSGAIAGQAGTYCLRVGSSNGTSTRLQAGQYIESINAVPLAGRECTLSFYIKFSAANTTASSGAYGDFLIFSNYYTGVDAASYSTSPASSATHVQITAGSLPTTWTKYTKTFTPPSTSKNITVQFQFSGLGQTSSDDAFYYELSNVQLELGSQATPFEHTSYGEELLLCQRYFQNLKACTAVGSGSNISIIVPLFTQMRTTPSLGKTSGDFNFGDMVSQGYQSSSSPTIDGGYLNQDLKVTGYIGVFSGPTNYRPYRHEPTASDGALITANAEI